MNRLRIVKAFAGVIISLASLHSVSGMYANAVLDTITISSGTVVPSTLAEGNSVVIKGTLKSDSSVITGVNVGVFDMEGCRVTGKTVYPNTKTYNLNELDDCILFDELEPGTYYYKVYASNASTSGTPLVEQKFTVTLTAKDDTIYNSEPAVLKNGTVVPDSIKTGEGVIIKGTVESEFRIAALTVGIFNKDDTAVHGKRVYPGTKKYDLNQLDSCITFSRLEPGEYYYMVLAADEKGNEYVLTDQEFTVKAGTAVKPENKDIILSGGTAVPLTLTQGYGVIVRGTVKSDYIIESVTAGVYNSAGKRVTGKTVSPDSYSYNLNKLDDYVLFSDLEPGTYTYKVVVSADGIDDLVLTKQSFTVKKRSSKPDVSEEEDKPSGDGVSLSGGTTVPKNIVQGNGVIVRGKLKSDNKITTVNVGVYDKNNKRVTGKTVYPSAYSYDLNKLDDFILFSDLEPGTYTYQVIAADAYDKNQVLTKQSFTVKERNSKPDISEEEDKPSADGVSLSGGTSVPASIKQGHGVIVKGKLTSDNKITAVTVGIYDKNNKRVTGKTVYPSAYSYDLGKLDEYIAFSNLEPGTYTYQVIAADVYDKNQVLTKQSFTVSKSGSDTSGSKTETDKVTSVKSVTLTNGPSVPAKLKEGEGVEIKGTLKSDSKMTTITVAVFDTNGKRVTGKTVYPSAYSYDLSKLDSYVNFHKLDAGRYTFEIIAANADSENNILVNKTFRVTE